MNNNEKQNVTIRLTEFYPDNCSEQEYIKVTERTERYMRRWKICEENRARKDRRYKLRSFDEIHTGECCGAYTPSHEEDICGYSEAELLYMAIENLPEYERELITLHYFRQVTMLDLAKRYGISKSAMGRHMEKARNIMKEFMLFYMKI